MKSNNYQSLVSVIIPIHNRFELADEAIQSVYEQTYRPIELILVDDCSDIPYIPKLSSERGFKVVLQRHKNNKGPGASRETGRQAATGDYMAYLDSDDLWHPEKLEKQVAALQAHPEAGMCYCKAIEFNQWPLAGNESLRGLSDRAYTEFLPVILEKRPWGTGACLWTREAIDLIGPWINSRHFEDVEYESRAGCLDIKISYVPEVLCYYRINNNERSLSESLDKSSANDLSKSILKISENLKCFNKLANDHIRCSLIQRLYKTAFSVLELNDRTSAFRLLREISVVSNNLFIKVIFLSVSSFSLIFPLSIMDKFKYRLKKFIYPIHENQILNL